MSWHIIGEQHPHPHEFLSDVILGLNDGVVTTLVFVLSVAGVSHSDRSISLAGIAEMLAGGVSMFLGAYMSARTEREAKQHQIAVERHEIEHEPDEEREELRQIYREKGFSGRQLTGIINHLTSDPDRWLNSMVRDELLLRPGEFRSPWEVGAIVGGSFAGGALVPIIPFLVSLANGQQWAVAISLAVLFATGAARSRYSRRSWLRSGIEMVVIGAIGTVAGLIIGRLLAAR